MFIRNSLIALAVALAAQAAAAQDIPRNGARVYVGSQFQAPSIFAGRSPAAMRLGGAPLSTAAAIGDVTADGFEDYVGLESGGSAVAVFDPVEGRVSRSFAFGGAGPGGVAVGDLDGDGVKDIVAVTDSGADIRIFDMFGKDQRMTGRGVSVAVGNFDGGPTQEIITLESDGTIVVRNTSGRIIATRSTGIGPQGAIAAGDLNGDGLANEFVAVANVGFAGIAIVDAAGRVTRPSGMGRSVAIGDIDNDGRNEILVGEADGTITVRDATGRLLRTIATGIGEATVAVGSVCVWSADEMTNADHDALPDQWETPGIDWDEDCHVDFWPGSFWSSNPRRADLFIEVNYMDCALAGGDCPAGDRHVHRMKPEAISIARGAFANAPVPSNPDGSTGVDLHVYVDEAVPHRMNCLWECYNDLTSRFFGERAERDLRDGPFRAIIRMKSMIFRRALFAHDQEPGNSSSGIAALPGFDFIVTLGSWDSQVGTAPDQAGTLLHELGHTLDLHHGGDDEDNCKPNYLSIMSYTYQVTGLPPSGVFDYSRAALAQLNEGNLNETLGVQDGPTTVFFGPLSNVDDVDQGGDGNLNDDWGSGPGNGPLDWNFNRTATDTSVSGDINNLGISGCTGNGGDLIIGDNDLSGFNDWPTIAANIQRRSPAGAYYGGGATSGRELRSEDAEFIKAQFARAAGRRLVLPPRTLRDLKKQLPPIKRDLPPLQGPGGTTSPPQIPSDGGGTVAPGPNAPSGKSSGPSGVDKKGADAAKDAAARLAAGTVDLAPSGTVDLDTGAVPGGLNADLWRPAKTATSHALAPRGGARLAAMGTAAPGREGCRAAQGSTAEIPFASLVAGTYLCVRTNAGNVSEVRIVSVGLDKLALAFTTWRP